MFLHKVKQEQNDECLLGIALLVTPIIKSTCYQGTPASNPGWAGVLLDSRPYMYVRDLSCEMQ